jgi:hypothetical protein
VAGRSAPGPAGGFPGPGQALRKPCAPARPAGACEAAWSPVPPFKGRSDRLHLREAALGSRRAGGLPSGQGCPTARRDRAARWRSARLRPRRCPRRSRRRHRPRRCPTTGVPLRPEGRSAGGPSSVGRRPPRIGPAGEPPGTAAGRGGGTWSLPVMACVRTTASILRTQLPASVASCQRSFRVGAAGPRPSWQTASWRPPKHTGGRARKCGARAPRLGPTASALHCRIGPITYNCYWESAERTPSARGRDEEGGTPRSSRYRGKNRGGGRSRLLPSNKAPASCRLSPM